MHEIPRLLTMPMFSQEHPAWSVPSLRWLRFMQHKNGFASAFKTVGKNRVLIDEAEFFRVIERQNRVQPGGPASR